MRKCLLAMLIMMLVILMLILVLLNLNTDYNDTDADLCIRIISLCCITFYLACKCATYLYALTLRNAMRGSIELCLS